MSISQVTNLVLETTKWWLVSSFRIEGNLLGIGHPEVTVAGTHKQQEKFQLIYNSNNNKVLNIRIPSDYYYILLIYL